jgi:hypothetical protein
MAGGVWRTEVDHVDDYIEGRRKVFDYNLFPLPQNLDLPQRERLINLRANPHARPLAVVS